MQKQTDNIEHIREEWRLRIENGETYDSIARTYNSPHIYRSLVWKILHRNYEPEKLETRAVLHLPLLKAVPVCECGEVHLLNQCPRKVAKNRKPKNHKDLFSYSTKQLLWMLENRTIIQE